MSAYEPWSPDRPGRGGAGGGDASPTVAVIIATACLLTLAGALIAGLTIGESFGEDGWKVRAKLVGLSGLSSFSGAGGTIAVGAALVAAAMLAGSSTALAGTARLMVGTAAGWLVIVGILAVVVDITFVSDSSDQVGPVLGGMVSDIGGVVLASGALLLAARPRSGP